MLKRVIIGHSCFSQNSPSLLKIRNSKALLTSELKNITNDNTALYSKNVMNKYFSINLIVNKEEEVEDPFDKIFNEGTQKLNLSKPKEDTITFNSSSINSLASSTIQNSNKSTTTSDKSATTDKPKLNKNDEIDFSLIKDEESLNMEIELLRIHIKNKFIRESGAIYILSCYKKLIKFLILKNSLQQNNNLNELITEINFALKLAISFYGENHIEVFYFREKLALALFYNGEFIESLKELHLLYSISLFLVDLNFNKYKKDLKNVKLLINYVSFYIEYFSSVFTSEQDLIFKIYTSDIKLDVNLKFIKLCENLPEWKRYEMAESFLFEKTKKEENILSKLILSNYGNDNSKNLEIRKQQDIVFELLKKSANLFEMEKKIKLAIAKYEYTLSRAINFYGKNSIEVADVLSNLCSLCNLVERYESGLNYGKRACILLNAITSNTKKGSVNLSEYEIKLGKCLVTIGEIYCNASKSILATRETFNNYKNAEKYISSGMSILDRQLGGKDNSTWLMSAYHLACNYDLLCICLKEMSTNDLTLEVNFTPEDEELYNKYLKKANTMYDLIEETIETSHNKYLLKLHVSKGTVEMEEALKGNNQMHLKTICNDNYPFATTIHEIYLASRGYYLLGDLEYSIEHLKKALSLFEQQYGNEYLFEREFTNNELANLLHSLDRTEEAIALLEESKERVEKYLGREYDNPLLLEIETKINELRKILALSPEEKKKQMEQAMKQLDQQISKLSASSAVGDNTEINSEAKENVEEENISEKPTTVKTKLIKKKKKVLKKKK
ncbi:hypothetical protein ABK040_012045 [Willaertia magna]